MKKRCLSFLILLTVFLLYPDISAGQGKYHFFYGKVINNQTGAAIPYVNIRFENRKTGSSTDIKGEFSVYLDSIPVIMVLSHIGYENRKVFLDNTSFSLMIEMIPEIRELAEVEIKAGGIEAEPVSRNKSFSVLDYEPDSGNVFILISRLKMSDAILILRTGQGDTVAKRQLTDMSPRRLFRDCLGNIHLVTGDSVYQLFRKNDSLQLLYGVTVKRFNSMLADCVLSTPDLLFFKKAVERDLGVSYFTVNRATHERQTISSVRDSARLEMAKKNPGDWNLLLRKRIPEGREDFVTWSYVHKILYRPLSSSLFLVSGSICVLNTADHTIEFYRPDGTYSSKLLINISTVKEGRWSGELYVDLLTNKVFTAFSRNGYYTLYKINLNTGDLVMTLPLEKLYPDKILVHNGFVYYLCREQGDNRTVDLFRQRL